MVDKVNPISGTGTMAGKSKQARVNPDGPSFRDFMRGKTGDEDDNAWLPGTLYEGILASDEDERRHILIGRHDLDLLIEPSCQNGRIVLRIDAHQDKLIEASILVIDGHPLEPIERVLMQLRLGPRKTGSILEAGQELAASFAEPEMAHIGGDSLGHRFIARILAVARPGDDLPAQTAPAGWQLVRAHTAGRERARLVLHSPIGRLLLESPARPAPESPVLLALPDTSRLQHHDPVYALPSRSSLSENMDAFRQQQAMNHQTTTQGDSAHSTLPHAGQANWGLTQKPELSGFLANAQPNIPAPSVSAPSGTVPGSPLDVQQQILAQSQDTDMPPVDEPEYDFDDEVKEPGSEISDDPALITEFEDNSTNATPTESDRDMVTPVTQNPASQPQPQNQPQSAQGQTAQNQPAQSQSAQGQTAAQGNTNQSGQPSNQSQTGSGNNQPPSGGSGDSAAASSRSSAQPVNVSTGAAGLGNGQQINALVTGSTPNGQALLQSGGVTLQSQTPLPKELLQASNLQLAITSSKGDVIQAEILSVDGKPLPGNKTISLVFTRFTGPPSVVVPGQTAQPGPGNILPGSTPLPPQPGQLLNGLLASPATGSGLTAGSQLQFQITGITLPGGTTTTLPGTSIPNITGSPQTAVPGQTANPGMTTTPPTTPGSPGSTVINPGQAKAPGAVTASGPGQAAPNIGNNPAANPAAPQGNPTSVTAGQTVTATVAALTAAGILLETSFGTVTLQGNHDLPVGAKLNLQLKSLQKPYAADAQRMAVMGADNRMAALDMLIEEWPALKDTLSLLQATSPQAAQSLMSRMPAMNARLTANILFFMNALGTNNIARFTGQAALDVLRQAGRADIADQLSSDFSQIGRLSSETSNSDWRAFMLPFYDGQNLQQVQFYLDQRNKGRDKKNKDDDPTHFVMNMSFSELGPMQLDGLVEPVQDNPLVRFNFDMTMRSRYKLADDVMQHIGSIFYAGLDVGGLTGNLSFKVVEQFPEDPLADLRNDKGSDIIV